MDAQGYRRLPKLFRAGMRGLGFGFAAVALAVGSVAASTQGIGPSGSIVQAVGSNTPTINASNHDPDHNVVTTVAVGTKVHVKLNISGNAGAIPTGVYDIETYPTADCSGLPIKGYAGNLDSSGALGTVDAWFVPFTSDTPATWSTRVEYRGDALYAKAIGPCRPITFVKATPMITLIAHNDGHQPSASIGFTETVHAAAHVWGPAGQPGNWVLVRAWQNGTCSGDDYVYTTKFLDGNGEADDILPVGFDQPSMRSYRARYSGDAHYNAVWSACAPVEGTKVAATLTFDLHDAAHQPAPATVPTSTTIHPAFGVSGAGGQPTGTVLVKFYVDADCQLFNSQGLADAKASSDDPTFMDETFNYPADVSWKATYSGDANHLPATSECQTVRFKASTTVTLQVHDDAHGAITTATVGDKVHLRATVNGDFGSPSGKVDLKIATNASCSNATALGTGTLSGGVSDDIAIDKKLATAGTVWFVAQYKGSSQYSGATSACVALAVSTAAVPTAAPTSAPSATGQPTPAPTASSPGSTTEPAAAPTPASTGDPSGSTEPIDPGASAAPDGTPVAGIDATPQPTDDALVAGPLAGNAGTGADDAGSGLPVWLLLLLAGLAGIVAWFVAARRRVPRQAGREPLAPAPTI
jgi:hypothetical protein